MTGTALQIVFDCADPARLAAFWADALDYKQEDPPEGFASWEDWAREQGIPEDHWNDANAVIDPAGLRPRLFFQRVPEPKQTKNRVHIDVKLSSAMDVPYEESKKIAEAEAQRLVGIGATVVSPVEQRGEFWIVMQDPEGNEFCVA